MRAMMFLVRASMYAIGLFAALSIAIAGPPTRSEMALLQQAASKLMRDWSVFAENASGDACTMAGVLCPSEAQHSEATPPPPVEVTEDAPPPRLSRQRQRPSCHVSRAMTCSVLWKHHR